MTPLELVTWFGPAGKWTWPFTPEQRLQLSSIPCMVDGGIIQVYAIGPDTADLILTFSPGWEESFGDADEGDRWFIRFGQMRLEDFEKLPEHTGW